MIKNDRKYYTLLYFGVMISGIMICMNPYIGYDEAYSMCLIRKGYGDIIRITAQDVHPPLYYLLLKTFLIPFGESVIAAKIFSLIVFIALVSLGPTLVKRIFSERTGLYYSFCVSLLPACQSYLYSEIRMYGLAALFVTLCVLAAIWIAKTGGICKNWMLLFVSGVLGAYTHYYALIAVALIYIVLLIVIVAGKSGGEYYKERMALN